MARDADAGRGTPGTKGHNRHGEQGGKESLRDQASEGQEGRGTGEGRLGMEVPELPAMVPGVVWGPRPKRPRTAGASQADRRCQVPPETHTPWLPQSPAWTSLPKGHSLDTDAGESQRHGWWASQMQSSSAWGRRPTLRPPCPFHSQSTHSPSWAGLCNS